jgi:hypothetical protein
VGSIQIATLDLGGGGVAAGSDTIAQSLGTLEVRDGGFSLASVFGIGAAVATDNVVTAGCYRDDGHRYDERPIKRLNGETFDASQHRAREYLPGLYNTAWSGFLKEHLVSLNGIAVLKDGKLARTTPLEFYVGQSKREGKAAAEARPDYVYRPVSGKVFFGEHGVLYRMFYGPESLVRCVDVVFPKNPVPQAKDGLIAYVRQGESVKVKFVPEVLR